MSSVSPLLRVPVLRVVEGGHSEVVVGIAQMEIAVDVDGDGDGDGGGDGVLECITDKGRGESGGGGGGVIVLDADATARASILLAVVPFCIHSLSALLVFSFSNTANFFDLLGIIEPTAVEF